MSGHNLPITPAPTLTPLAFMQKWLPKLADNEFENIVEETLRELVLDLFGTFPTFNGLTVKQVKGATYPVPFTDSLGTIPVGYRVLGMQAMARNGTDAASAGAGVTAPPVYFQLVRDSAGPVDALIDEELNTVATVKARWVKVSGTEADKIASFPVLLLEDQDYVAGDVRQYTFPGGQTRLVQWKDDSIGYTHPAPTGEDTDPIYRNFAPLNATSTPPSFFQVTGDPLANPLLATLLAGKQAVETYAALTYAAIVALDFTAAAVVTLPLTGNVIFVGSNYAQGRRKRVFVTADATNRTLAFPSAWVWYGTKPTSLAAGKEGVLTLECLGSNSNQVRAAWAAQS